MNREIVERLEREIDQAITAVITALGLSQLPVMPSRRTIHLMSKAAVAVYEAAAERPHGSRHDA